MRLIFATGNRGKLNEASEILGNGFKLTSPAEMGILEEIPETGNTLRANSAQKARYIYEKTGAACFADDSGLEVDALNGDPGVHSARYAGNHDFEANIDKVLSELAKVPQMPRTARFKCVITLILDGEEHIFEGSVEGVIASKRTGDGGFGYDPIFLPDGFDGKSFAEIGEEQKNKVSHRGKALKAMEMWLKDNK